MEQHAALMDDWRDNVAIGIVMANEGLTAEQASASLVSDSSSAAVETVELAQQLIGACSQVASKLLPNFEAGAASRSGLTTRRRVGLTRFLNRPAGAACHSPKTTAG